MGGLIPEARVNVNGVSVIKHVRPNTPKSSSASKLPAPALPATKTAKKKPLAKARTEQNIWSEIPSMSRADHELKLVARNRFPNGRFLCKSSDVELYSVMSVVSPLDSSVVVACDAKSPEAAVDFLEKNNLGYLIEDHSELANAALERNIPASAFIKACSELNVGHWSSPNFLDAVEAYSIKALRGEQDRFTGIPFQILHGEISLKDVKTIGASRLAVDGTRSEALRELRRIKAGESKLDAKSIKALMMKFNPDNHKGRSGESITMAATYGAETVLQIHDFERAFDLERRLRRDNHPVEEIAELMLWNDRLQRIDFHPLSSTNVVLLHKTGIDLNRLSELLNRDLEPNQIVGIMEHDVPVSVADGWL